jgi:2-polyprenyl-3-methyl-5-hydroxy-6-metoxy-1,4-benzoquinol methylase
MNTVSSGEQLRHESVACDLCGATDTSVRFTIENRAGRSGSMWLNGQEHTLTSLETIVQCRCCGLVYVNPRLAENANMTAYSTEQELEYFAKTRVVRLRAYATLLRNVPRWLATYPATLLDVGCGDGAMLEVARQCGIQVHGTEVNSALKDLVRERMGPDVLLSCDLDQAPTGHYDVATLINVIEHLRSPAAMLCKIHRLLRPDGLLLIHAPNLGGIPARITGANWHQIRPYGHMYYFTIQTITKVLSKSGFALVDRFELYTAPGWKRIVQSLEDRLGLHVGNGLGVAARRVN